MQRSLISSLREKVGTEVSISGWISVRRDQGKMIFFDVRDRSGSVQGVVLPRSGALDAAKEVRAECVVTATGIINKRPDKNINAGVQNGDIELEIRSLTIISKAEVPFERGAEVTLETHLDHLPYTLRFERSKDIFTLQATILAAYRNSLTRQGFTEFVAPALVGSDAEGGSAVFRVEYFNDKTAYLATSPQLYKQIMVGVFERAFTVAKVFRAEKSATTRHLSEITQLDFEMGFIESELEPMKVLEQVMKDVVSEVLSAHEDILKRFGISTPRVPTAIPILTLREAQKLLGAAEEPDLTPEQERALCDWALKEKDSDFLFITRFPTATRAFYTYEDPAEAPFSRGFDLLFRGLEINSGAQRIHMHDELVRRITERGMDQDKFSFYLEAFKVGMPPHGGCSTGLERLTARMLGLANVKEAAAFPRDMHRIDARLSQEDE